VETIAIPGTEWKELRALSRPVAESSHVSEMMTGIHSGQKRIGIYGDSGVAEDSPQIFDCPCGCRCSDKLSVHKAL